MSILKRILRLFKKKNHLLNPPKLRKDVLNIKVQEDVYFQVYWKVLEIGKGPAVILYIFSREVLKFDCFGKAKGHFHVAGYKLNGSTGKRIYFKEESAYEQIEWTVHELKTNHSHYLQKNKNKRIRELHIDQKDLESAIVSVRSKMIEFIENIPELAGI